ncbi:MAG: tetratricopeptide repeat protein [Porticoccaceae bacterium]|nr:tetratricopeptide repeat protein [Porticoccaceae bacterium]MDG1473734.1 tetratricopeptide repeat protein [Porticoccaceae bacterium]
MKSIPTLGFLLLMMAPVAPIVAQNVVPVVEAGNVDATVIAEQVEAPGLSDTAQLAANRYDVMLDLREEVRALRGMVEKLGYELQQVKQQQLDDYLDIDRRLGASTAGDLITASTNDDPNQNSAGLLAQNSEITSSIDTNGRPEQTGRDFYEAEVKDDYSAASNKLLKDRDIEGAAEALKLHLDSYPESPFAANAHYWLGEIYLLSGDTELARQSFTMIIEQYPDHSKGADSKFKLGKIYFQLGQRGLAREYLEAAASSNGGVAEKATKFIETNFQ